MEKDTHERVSFFYARDKRLFSISLAVHFRAMDSHSRSNAGNNTYHICEEVVWNGLVLLD